MRKEKIEEKIEEIKGKMTGKQLFIQNVPKRTFDRFKEMSNSEDFMNHYGFLLKHLVDFYDGMITSGVEHLEAEILNLQERISALEQKKPEEKKARTMCDGKEIGGKEDE